MKEAYISFYLEGRDDRALKHDIDTEEIARMVVDGKGTIHELLMKAAKSAAEPHLVARKKRSWIEESDEEIKAAGGDSEEAYRHYIDGRIDELVYKLEVEVLEVLEELCGGESEEGEDEDGEDDEEGDDKE